MLVDSDLPPRVCDGLALIINLTPSVPAPHEWSVRFCQHQPDFVDKIIMEVGYCLRLQPIPIPELENPSRHLSPGSDFPLRTLTVLPSIFIRVPIQLLGSDFPPRADSGHELSLAYFYGLTHAVSLINENILGKCFRSSSSYGDPRVSPLTP